MRFKNFEIKNKSRNRRNGFSHDSTLLFNGVEIGKASVHYYNRTWESYRFQTSMLRVVDEAIEHNKKLVRKHVFSDWKRLNDARKLTLHNYFKTCELGGFFGQDLIDLKLAIKDGKGEPDPVLNSMKAFLLMGDLMGAKDNGGDITDVVKYKERIVFATMRNKIPNWEPPSDWGRLNDMEKLDRLNKIQTFGDAIPTENYKI